MATFHVENFGCRAARADGEAVSTRLESHGLVSQALGQAEVVIVNTCSVTAEADREARAFIRKSVRLNPTAKVLVTGCYAQRAPQELASLDGVDAIVGNSHKALVPDIVLGLLSDKRIDERPRLLIPTSALIRRGGDQAASMKEPGTDRTASIWADDSFAHSSLDSAQVSPGMQTRPNLKIQEGCSNRCTFCIIPTTRGNSRSLDPVKVLAQIEGFVAAGGKELVLSGINLGRWGRDLTPGNTLAHLLRTALESTALPRLRLSSIEPMDWTSELIALISEYAASRLARHAHMPLQSGSDAVLRRMHRRYRPWHYAKKVAQLVEAVGSSLALGADIMVGFPAETDSEFQETYDFITSQPFTYLHLFPFSPRPGTPGWELHRQSPVPSKVVGERLTALQALIASKSRRFRESFIGKTLPAITLNSPESLTTMGLASALTDNYLPVEIAVHDMTNSLPANQLIDVRITSVQSSNVIQAELRMGDLRHGSDFAVAI